MLNSSFQLRFVVYSLLEYKKLHCNSTRQATNCSRPKRLTPPRYLQQHYKTDVFSNIWEFMLVGWIKGATSIGILAKARRFIRQGEGGGLRVLHDGSQQVKVSQDNPASSFSTNWYSIHGDPRDRGRNKVASRGEPIARLIDALR